MSDVKMNGYYALVEMTDQRRGFLRALGPKARKDIDIGTEVEFSLASYFDINGKRHAIVSDVCMARV